MLYPYYTAKKTAICEINIQKSRFIGYIRRISTEDEAKSVIEAVSKEHWKANHHCFAYCIGDDNHLQKASDNGEPSGTAGVPILEVIKKRQLRDTLIIVTRYFGGIKLGAGGLIRAYSKAASTAIEASGIVERLPMKLFSVTIDYSLYGTIENVIRDTMYLIRDTQFTENVTIKVAVRSEQIDRFLEWITNISNGACVVEEQEETFIEVDA